jgi:single-strand DNA-binding protein
MASVNKVTLIGHLGKDPEQRDFDEGKLVTFSLATSESWNNRTSGERQERTQWHQIAIWNEALGEVAMKYLKKGSQAYVEGQLETRQWDKDGEKRYATEVVLRPFRSDLVLLDKPDRPAQQPARRRDRGSAPAQR